MKKVFLTLALVFATSTVLVSCGDDASKDATEESTPDADAKKEDNKEVKKDASGNPITE